MEKSLNSNGKKLYQLLLEAQLHVKKRQEKDAQAQKVHIAGAGGTLTAAYEQLRNAAENAEEHVLLQRAIRRFYRRLFLLRDGKQIKDSGEELAIELTLAGYLLNDTLPDTVVSKITHQATSYYKLYEELLRRKYSHEKIEKWTIEVLAVQIEWLLHDPAISSAYTQFVYEYYVSSDQAEHIFDTKPDDLDLGLYVAIQRALLKADLANIRAGLLARYRQSPSDIEDYIQTNQQIDKLLESGTAEKLFRYIDRRGAPLRVLRHMIDDDAVLSDKLSHQNEFISSFEAQIQSEYRSINSRINRGIVKSVVFLIITKVLIGVAVEIPYDSVVLGAIALTPLVINLLFPPIYMILLRMTLMIPKPANSTRLSQQIDEMLYGQAPKLLERRNTRAFGTGYNVAYVLGFIIVFGGIGFWLYASFHFELIHLFIFFLFLSGASFLGFRLSRMIREIEAVDSDQNAITTARDFLYMPFVVVGRYMSEKYAQVNIVALTLDMVIELPLKTILRLIRQWAAFINSKKDAL